MKSELEQKLYDKYPALLKNVVYLEVGDGWYTLLDNMLGELSKFDVNFVQIKSKFGGLRAYHQLRGTDRGCIDEIINKYEKLSTATCEHCGAAAYGRSCGGWWTTLCDEHYEEWKQSYNGR